MNLNSLHLMLTYRCTLACDHCFVWGSPYQTGEMSLDTIHTILRQAQEMGTIESIYFEGGEAFLCYPVLLAGIQASSLQGFETAIVSNGYWANSIEVAVNKLRPMTGYLDHLIISDDLFHLDEKFKNHNLNALAAARQLGIPCEVIEIDSNPADQPGAQIGQLQAGVSNVMYRGRAALTLAEGNNVYPGDQFSTCPYENLLDPARVHLDPLGYVHICQGISMGNIFQNSIKEIWENYDPDKHPIVGPLMHGGPAELCTAYGLPNDASYADACHLCYRSRQALRPLFPEVLAPDQMYGIYSSRQASRTAYQPRRVSHQKNSMDRIPAVYAQG